MACSPLSAAADKKAGKIPVITLPNGRQVSIGVYVKAWKELKTLDGEIEVKGFGFWAEPVREVLHSMARATNDRINIRGGIDIGAMKEPSTSRILRHLQRTVKCECRWCGSPLAGYRQKEARFCSDSCRRDFWS